MATRPAGILLHGHAGTHTQAHTRGKLGARTRPSLNAGGSPAPLVLPPRLPHLTSKPRAPARTFSRAACAGVGHASPSNVQRKTRGAPPPPSYSPRGFRSVYRRFRVRAVAVLAPCAVLRFTRARSSWLGSRADTTNVVRVVPSLPRHRTTLLWSCLSALPCVLNVIARGDFGFRALVRLSRPCARVRGRVPPARVGSAYGRPLRPRPTAASAPARTFGFRRQPNYPSDMNKNLGLPKKPLSLWDSRSRPPRNPFFLGTLHYVFDHVELVAGVV